MAALLFLALAFFAVGQAGAARNGARTAADAAALAAAQDYRDQLRTGLLTALAAGADAQDWLAGRGADTARACTAAASYAAANGARRAVACDEGDRPGSFTVAVVSAASVGRSVVPGTEHFHAKATATAVVAPRCAAGPAAGQLTCDGRVLDVDPRQQRPGTVVKAADLFTVHLAK